MGSQQLAANRLARCVHVISNASEQLLHDFAFAKNTQAKIILVADDAGPSMRASGVPVVRTQAMSSDAEEAVAAARAAKRDWHQLEVQKQFCPNQADVPHECSGKDASLETRHPALLPTSC